MTRSSEILKQKIETAHLRYAQSRSEADWRLLWDLQGQYRRAAWIKTSQRGAVLQGNTRVELVDHDEADTESISGRT